MKGGLRFRGQGSLHGYWIDFESCRCGTYCQCSLSGAEQNGKRRDGNACFRDRNSYCAFNAGRGNCHSAEYDKITVWALDTN